MQGILDDLLRTVTRRIARREVAPLTNAPAHVRWSTWARLRRCRRLLETSVGRILRKDLSTPIRNTVNKMRALIVSAERPLSELTECIKKETTATSAIQTPRPIIRVGVGCPGVQGCADITGNVSTLHPLMDKRTGVFKAMDKLGIDIMGLPGARLRPCTTPPPVYNMSMEARWLGGTCYDSTAAVWSNSLPARTVPDIGNVRSLWLSCDSSDGAPLSVCFTYFPTQGDRPADDKWLEQLAVLATDLSKVATDGTPDTLRRTLITGDFNFQPPELGGSNDTRPVRQRAWAAFMRTWRLVLHNPTLHSDCVKEVTLPLRKRTTRIRTGSTRHDHHIGRAIDLVLTSQDLCVEVTIHNSIHCSLYSPCAWPLCLEYARGDHFLIVIDVLLDHVIDFGSAYPRFPASWCKTERWLNAFEHAVPQLQALIDLTRLVDDNTDAWRSQDDETQRWIIESLAWMQTVIAGAVRDGTDGYSLCFSVEHVLQAFVNHPASSRQRQLLSTRQLAIRSASLHF